MSQQYLDFTSFEESPDSFKKPLLTANIDYFYTTPLGRCLGYILSGLKWNGEIDILSYSSPHMSEKFDLIHLCNTMAHLGYKTQESDLTFAQIDSRLFPCLFIEDKNPNHPLVVLSQQDDKLKVYDGLTQKTFFVDRNHFKKGRAYFFASLSNEEMYFDEISTHVDPSVFTWFMQVINRMKPQLHQGILLTFFITLFGILTSLYIKVLYDRVINVHAMDSLAYLLPGILLAIAMDFVMREMRLRVFSWFGARLDAIMSPFILEKIFKLPPTMSESAALSSQLSRLRDFDAVRSFCSGTLMMTLLEIPFTLLMILAVYIMAGNLVFIPLILILLFVLLMTYFTPKISRSIEESARLGAKRYTLTIETVDKLKYLQTMGNNKVWFDQLRLASGVATIAGFRSGFLSSIVETCSYAMYVVSGFAAISYGIYLVIIGDITSGAVIGSMLLIWRILTPLQTCMSSISAFVHFKKSVQQVHKLLSLRTEDTALKHTLKMPQKAPTIAFTNVIFKHPTQPTPIFNGLNLTIEPGEIIMIVGRNGSGKTTLLKLLEGLYHPQVGSIKINNNDIRQFDLFEYRRAVSYVPDKPDLFFGTIAQNLRIATPSATDEQIQDVLEKLGCAHEISGFSEGIHHRIGDSETQIVTRNLGFQISLARAILRDAPIFLIDEAPHYYFQGDEGYSLEKFIKKWKGKKTTFMVANNEEMIPLADRVMYLIGDGRILVGTPSEILKVIKKQYEFNFEE